MAKFDIKNVTPKFVVTTSPENKIDVVVNKPIIESKNSKNFFKLKNTGGPKGEKGDKGDAATISVASTSTGEPGTDASVVNQGTSSDAQLAFTIPRGDKGDKGDKGDQGRAATVIVANTITGEPGTDASVVNQGTAGDAVLKFTIPRGEPGQAGADGYSPSATVTQTASGATISITDKDGTTTADISNGTDGQDGAPGTDGYSPSATVTQTSTGATISITDKDGTTTANVNNGTDGTDGTDGFSPVATVIPTATGATVSITDAQGTTTADITNGTDGTDGQAATIAVGTVTTLQPNQSAYVTNVGTSSAAIFDIGIPQGQKGEAGSGSGDMLAADYDPNNTVKNAGGITDYVATQIPGDMTGASSSAAGAHGLVPAPAAGDQGKVLKGDGTWGTPTAELVEMSYGEANAWTKFINARNKKSIVYCRASSNSNPATGSQTRKAFMAYVNNADSPTSVEFQYVRSVGTKTAFQPVDQVFIYTLTNANGGTWSVTTRDTGPKLAAGNNASVYYNDGSYTISAVQPTVNDATLTITQNGTSAGTFTANASSNTTIALTDTTYSNFVGATGSADGAAGLVPAPTLGEQYTVLLGDGTWGYVDKWYYLNNDPTTASSVSIYGDPSVTGSPVEIQELLTGSIVVLIYSANSGAQEKRFNVIGTQPDWQNGTATITLADENGNTIILSGSVQSSTATVSRVSPTPPDMTGATAQTAGAHGLVPAPAAGDEAKVLSGAGTWVNQPTMPTVNNGTLTIQKNGTDVKTFTANQSSNATANITVPTALSELTGTVSTSQIADSAVTSSKIDWTTFETGWIELSQTYGVKYKRVGKTVTLAMLNPSNITMTGYVERLLVAATDGAIIAPSIELRFPVYGRNNTAIYGLITTAGKISLFNWGPEQAFEAGGLTFTVTYNID